MSQSPAAATSPAPGKTLRRRATTRPRLSFGRALAYGLVAIVAALYLAPILVMINTALKSPKQFLLDPAGLATSLTFSNFAEAWKAANFAAYIGNTLLYTLISTGIYLILATFVAFPLSRNYVRGSRWLYLLYVVALFLPNNLIPQFQLMLRLGLYNNRIGYILLTLTGGLGILILHGYVQSIPRDLDEAAAMDGCSYFQFVIRVIMPLIKPALATVALLHAIGIWNDLILPMIYLTSKSYYPVTRGLMVFYGQFGTAWTQLAAATIIMVAPLVVLFIFLQRYIIEGALRGSLKG